MDGWMYEKVDEIHKLCTHLVTELEAAKKKGKPKE